MLQTTLNAMVMCARYARWVLVLGLMGGLLFQDVAYLARPYIPAFIAALLFVASFRIGPKKAIGAASSLREHLVITLQMQVVFPLAIVVIVLISGYHNVYLTAIVLVASAAPISGSPNLVIMLGHTPAPALRQLVVGTALLPATVIPIFMLLPVFGNAIEIGVAAGKLLLVIGGAASLGFLARHCLFSELSESNTEAVDGFSAILMALVVVGLMSALGDAWRQRPTDLLLMMLFVFILNFGFQFLGSRVWHRLAGPEYAVPLSVISGNRNVALYLTALPAAVVDDLLLFIGCYQFPMYLTPLLLRRFYSS